MTNDIYVYEIELPNDVSEIVAPCLSGYTVYLNQRLCPDKKKRALDHAVRHIENKDFEKIDVQEIERRMRS